jgi:subfamily B ATP-binding cassette protein MsbA
MNTKEIIKRLYNDYVNKFIFKILLAAIFSILVAASTSATAWLLDPAIEKIFLNKDKTLIFLIPLAIIIVFSTKGIAVYKARIIMIQISEEVKKMLQIDMLKSFINADTQIIENKHTGKYISNLNFDVEQI